MAAGDPEEAVDETPQLPKHDLSLVPDEELFAVLISRCDGLVMARYFRDHREQLSWGAWGSPVVCRGLAEELRDIVADQTTTVPMAAPGDDGG